MKSLSSFIARRGKKIGGMGRKAAEIWMAQENERKKITERIIFTLN
jgi:hypothetical protein